MDMFKKNTLTALNLFFHSVLFGKFVMLAGTDWVLISALFCVPLDLSGT
jgi:hypothetical protein